MGLKRQKTRSQFIRRESSLKNLEFDLCREPSLTKHKSSRKIDDEFDLVDMDEFDMLESQPNLYINQGGVMVQRESFHQI